MTTLPEPFASIPRHQLLYPHPSPIHPLPKLTSSLPSKPTTTTTTIWAKREDQSSPLACCGNKFRKLEYLIPDILSHRSPTTSSPVTTLVTEGGIQSNHTAQVAAVAAYLGLESLVLLHRNTAAFSSASDQTNYLKTGNVQICTLLGSTIHYLEPNSQKRTSTNEDTTDHIEPHLSSLREAGKTPYFIPSGASLHPLGGLGYARCAFEIADQETHHLSHTQSKIFDHIFVACGSGSTLAGLIAGFKLLQQESKHPSSSPRKITGILISPTKPLSYHQTRILTLAREAGSKIGLRNPAQDITPEDVVLDAGYAGSAYAVLDGSTRGVVERLARGDGILLDPVYTGKVMEGVMGWVGEEGLREEGDGDGGGGGEKNVLFIHTGGQAAWGAYVQ
ncbi:hypothetical protein FQN54_009672 [Arachnomyces sp. PD_36]|nr:hypothetical protein FQN54_009672 [Arachnomyces sp. PD_36]